ncbi:MAG: GNAT family N-acetyltransferase, partial [Yoonia sp.]
LGFSYDGLFKQALVYKGRNRDTAWYSIIDTDWPRIRAGLEGWLDAGNFDQSGAQRTRLDLQDRA